MTAQLEATLKRLEDIFKFNCCFLICCYQFWNLCTKDDNNKVTKQDYVKLNVLIAKYVLPDFEEQQALTAAEVIIHTIYIIIYQYFYHTNEFIQLEWQKDSPTSSGLTYEEFYGFVFEILDIWAKGLQAVEYHIK